MTINLGSSQISKIYLGPTEIQKAYLGNNLIYEVSTASYLYDDLTVKPDIPLSTRLINSGYSGYSCRVRRGSDNVEVEVNFDTDNEVSLDSTITEVVASTTLAANLGEFIAAPGYTNADSLGSSDDAYISRWYFQNASGIYAYNTTTTDQPVILSNGAFDTINGKPAIRFDTSGGGQRLYIDDAATFRYTDQLSINFVNYGYSNGEGGYGGIIDKYRWGLYYSKTNEMSFRQYSSLYHFSAYGESISSNQITTFRWYYNEDLGQMELYKNGSLAATSSRTFTLPDSTGKDVWIGSKGTDRDGDFKTCEMLVFPEKLSPTDLSTLHTSQSNFYGIT